MLFKKIISLLVLSLYLHGMSGYTMSFHTCLITGFENVYAGYDLNDPCGEEENDCQEKTTQIKPADCCDVQQTIISLDEDAVFSNHQIYVVQAANLYQHFQTNSFYSRPLISAYLHLSVIRPPEPSSICIFRI
jgi:hypothetical protein